MRFGRIAVHLYPALTGQNFFSSRFSVLSRFQLSGIFCTGTSEAVQIETARRKEVLSR
jgi:hypothetical protein